MKGRIRTENPTNWLGIWLGKSKSGKRPVIWGIGLNTDFTEEKCGVGAGF